MKFFFPVSILILFIACTNHKTAKKVDPDSIYFDYTVSGDEEGGYVTVRLQYMISDSEGETVLLESPAKVELDGVTIAADSSKRNGVYYEVIKPAKEFEGRHTIVFTDINGKKYEEEFSYRSLSLTAEPPVIISRADLAFDLNGLDAEDQIRVLMNDTARFSQGIDRVDTVKNGHVVITKADLASLVSGPVTLEFSREQENWITNGTREGGMLSISNVLKREFELKDSLP